jgi:hypothetical protein
MNVHNVTRLLTYLENLKVSGEEDKWDMEAYLTDRTDHSVMLFPGEVTNWHCGTAGCLAGSWSILRVKDGHVPPETTNELTMDFAHDLGLTNEQQNAIINGYWSPNGLSATLDEAIAYLRLCLAEGTMDVTLDT